MSSFYPRPITVAARWRGICGGRVIAWGVIVYGGLCGSWVCVQFFYFRQVGCSEKRSCDGSKRTARQDRSIERGAGFFSRCLQPVGVRRRQEMVEPSNDNLSIRVQCRLLTISRSGWYYDPKGEHPLNLRLMRLIDEQFLLTPYYGSRQMARHLRRQGYCVACSFP